MLRMLIIILLAPLLAACEFQTFKSSVAGSCGVFERPPYAVRGKTAYDQNVADNFVESGVAGCNWKRPSPRPASLDAAPDRKVAPAPVKRRSLVKRIRDRILPPKVETPPPVVVAPPAAEPEPPPAPRRPIDELLRPSR
jgi:hypothetical protein